MCGGVKDDLDIGNEGIVIHLPFKAAVHFILRVFEGKLIAYKHASAQRSVRFWALGKYDLDKDLASCQQLIASPLGTVSEFVDRCKSAFEALSKFHLNSHH